MGIDLDKVNEVALAITLGLTYGIILFAIGILSWLTGWGGSLLPLYSEFFPGFGPTVVGSVAGLIYGLVIGGLFGFIIGVIYNYFAVRVKIR